MSELIPSTGQQADSVKQWFRQFASRATNLWRPKDEFTQLELQIRGMFGPFVDKLNEAKVPGLEDRHFHLVVARQKDMLSGQPDALEVTIGYFTKRELAGKHRFNKRPYNGEIGKLGLLAYDVSTHEFNFTISPKARHYPVAYIPAGTMWLYDYAHPKYDKELDRKSHPHLFTTELSDVVASMAHYFKNIGVNINVQDKPETPARQGTPLLPGSPRV